MDDFLLLYLSLQYSLRYTQCYPVSLGFYGWKKLRGLRTVGKNLKAGPVWKFAFFEYKNLQRYRQSCLLTGVKFALNYQNKILFLLRQGRILFKVKIKILKNLRPSKTVILNFVADIFLTVFVRALARQNRPWIHTT